MIRRLATFLLLGGLAAAPAMAETPDEVGPRLVRADVVVLTVRPLTAILLDDPETAVFVVDPARGAERKLGLGWPEPDDRCSLLLRVAERPSGSAGVHRLSIDAGLTLADGTRVQSNREFDVHERATTLFEIYRIGDRSLTLAFEGQVESRTTLPGRPTIGAPVLFEVQVQRVIEGRVVPLESNNLNTFVGETVAYSFNLGPAGVAESARLSLLPLRVTGEVVEIEVTLTGSLPGSTAPQLVSRTEQWFASRNTATVAAFETGDPPTGYRFLVTPRF